jgi:hypothetical protein
VVTVVTVPGSWLRMLRVMVINVRPGEPRAR